MSNELLKIVDDAGRELDAHIALCAGEEGGSVTFESQGGGRNSDYFKGHTLVIARLALLFAKITDALVVSADTKHLVEAKRRFYIDGQSYPFQLSPDIDFEALARKLRRGAAEVGRKHLASGPGNRAKRVQLKFSFNNPGAQSYEGLKRCLVSPGSRSNDETSENMAALDNMSDAIFMSDPNLRRAVERRAMEIAIDYLKDKWDSVSDVSVTESFDLLCTAKSSELRVEVKGTTGDGAAVILTRNEVIHAQKNYPNVALYVVSGIRLKVIDGLAVASGGDLLRYEPWNVDIFELVPISFRCSLAAR